MGDNRKLWKGYPMMKNNEKWLKKSGKMVNKIYQYRSKNFEKKLSHFVFFSKTNQRTIFNENKN